LKVERILKKYRKYILLLIVITFLAFGYFLRIHYLAFADQAKSSEKTYGIAVGDSFPSMSQSAILSELHQIKSVGFTAVRFDVPWDVIQPTNDNSYTWAKFDQIFNDVKQSGLKALPIIDYTPSWARPSNCKYSNLCAPASAAQFATYAGQIVKKYQSSDIIAWEIWNEPNTVSFWKPYPNAASYTSLLKAAYLAIKQQSSSNVVLIGGLSGSTGSGGVDYIDARTFLSQLYHLGARKYFDGLAYHPYTNLYLPNQIESNSGWSKIDALNLSIRSIMVANGDQNKKIWITEMGIPTDGPGQEITNPNIAIPTNADYVSENLQAVTAQEALSYVKNQPWIASFFWFSYQDAGASKNSAENFYGLVTQNGIDKPAFNVFYRTLK
jgi:hypothetical protein